MLAQRIYDGLRFAKPLFSKLRPKLAFMRWDPGRLIQVYRSSRTDYGSPIDGAHGSTRGGSWSLLDRAALISLLIAAIKGVYHFWVRYGLTNAKYLVSALPVSRGQGQFPIAELTNQEKVFPYDGNPPSPSKSGP